MTRLLPLGNRVSLPLSGVRRTLPAGNAVPLPLLPRDTIIIVGPDGTTIKQAIRAVASRRVLVEQEDGSWMELWAYSNDKASQSNRAGRLPLLNGIGQFNDWMMPSSLPRRALLHMQADGIATEFTIEHRLNRNLVHLAFQDTGTLLSLDIPYSVESIDSNHSKVTFTSEPPLALYLVSAIG